MTCAREKIPGLTFSADVIVGFPGETEEDFLETVEFCRSAQFSICIYFPIPYEKERKRQVCPIKLPHGKRSAGGAYLAAAQKEVQDALLNQYVRSIHLVRYMY